MLFSLEDITILPSGCEGAASLVNPAISELVKGVMVESYLLPGAQKINEHEFGKSITDACLGWDETERLIDQIAERL